MTIDTQTVAELSALTISVVGVFKFLIPDGKNQNNYVRLMSAVVGTLVFLGHVLAVPGVVTLATAASVLLPAAAQGFTVGAGATVAVKAYHVAQDRLSTPTPTVAGLAPVAVPPVSLAQVVDASK